jgi:hypothetical protein
MIDRCKWVGDFFNCKVNITADDRNVYIGFYPLLTDICVAQLNKKGVTITPLTYHTYISTHLTHSHLLNSQNNHRLDSCV